MTSEGRGYLTALSKTRQTLLNGNIVPVGVEKRLAHEDIFTFRGRGLGGGGVSLRWTYPKSSHRGQSKSRNPEKNSKKRKESDISQSQFDVWNSNVSKSRVHWASVVEEIPELPKSSSPVTACGSSPVSAIVSSFVLPYNCSSKESACSKSFSNVLKGSFDDNSPPREPTTAVPYLSQGVSTGANWSSQSKEEVYLVNSVHFGVAGCSNILPEETSLEMDSLVPLKTDDTCGGFNSTLKEDDVGVNSTTSKEAAMDLRTLYEENTSETNASTEPKEGADKALFLSNKISSGSVSLSNDHGNDGIFSTVEVSSEEKGYLSASCVTVYPPSISEAPSFSSSPCSQTMDSVLTSVNPTMPHISAAAATSPLISEENSTPRSSAASSRSSIPSIAYSTQAGEGEAQTLQVSGLCLPSLPAENSGAPSFKAPSPDPPVLCKNLSTPPGDQNRLKKILAPSASRLGAETECDGVRTLRKRKSERETASSVLREKGRCGSSHLGCKLKPFGRLGRMSKRTVLPTDMIDDVVDGVRELVGSARAEKYWVLGKENPPASVTLTVVRDSQIPKIQQLVKLKHFK